MQRKSPMLAAILLVATQLFAQVEPNAGTWKTWFIPSGQTYRLAAPPVTKNELARVLTQQQNLDAAGQQQITYWNTGAPGYHWQHLMGKLWMDNAGSNGALANMLLSVAIYDATITAWDTKYTYKRPRPYLADKRIKALIVHSPSPSYPCEHSVAAGVAVTVISHFYPTLADSVQRMAQRLMVSRVAAGVAFPSDTKAGFDLGKRIAEKEIEHTKDFPTKEVWDGKMPTEPGLWKGKYAFFPLAGLNKTVVLESSSQYRPGPPPDFAKDMEELKKSKHTFSSVANAFHFASEPVWEDLLEKKIFENNLHLNPPRVARIYAIAAIGIHDGFTACWDAKYTYWGTRPDQYDPTFRPVLIQTPPFPGYPSGHAAIGGVMGELYAYFFPAESTLFRETAKDGAESRFQGGIHFRTDNEVGLELGKKVGTAIINRVKNDGADKDLKFYPTKAVAPLGN